MADSDAESLYLQPDFDPTSLTVPKLRAILVEHDIAYPSSAKKAQLVEIFQDQLVPRSKRLLSARARIKRTSRGIEDVPSSQNSTMDGTADGEDSMAPSPIPKTPGRTGRRATRGTAEGSGKEAESSVPSVRKPEVSRRTSSKHARADGEAAGAEEPQTARRKTRVSEAPVVKVESGERPRRPQLGESAFSNENPFQSGSSPLGEGEARRRSSGVRTLVGKSNSRRRTAMGDSIRVKQEDDGIQVPTLSTFDVPVSRLANGKKSTRKHETTNTIEAGEEFTPDEQEALTRDQANAQVAASTRRTKKKSSSGLATTGPLVVLATILAGFAAVWRQEKLAVGYCGLSSASAPLSNVKLPEWASGIRPQCEPCPQHAYCYPDFEARCEPDWMLESHPLSLGGLIPLPPTCEPDGEKVRKVKAVADRVVEELRQHRAKYECGVPDELLGSSVQSPEIEEETLKARVSAKRRRGMSESEFEELWRGAIGDVLGRDEVASNTNGLLNGSNRRLSSSSLARIPVACGIQRSARITVARYRSALASLVILSGIFFYVRSQILTYSRDKARVPELLAMIYDRLATQAARHAQGRGAEQWISVAQLRDDVLRDELSSKRRERIWKMVQTKVEPNTNIRPAVNTLRAGDVGRTWEWTGALPELEDAWNGDRRVSGRHSLGLSREEGRRDSKSVERFESDSTGIGTGSGEVRKWNEGRPIY